MKYEWAVKEEEAVDFIFAANDLGVDHLSSVTKNGVTTFTLRVNPLPIVERMHEAYTNPKTKPESNE